MAHYAKIDNNNIVIKVIVIDEEIVNSGVFGEPNSWIQTSFNTYGGEHSLGGTPLRKNYAGLGYTYDKDRDAFIPPKPYPSWILDEDTCQWDPPVEYPTGHDANGPGYDWDEDTTSWILNVEG
jgi:hypothetical protein